MRSLSYKRIKAEINLSWIEHNLKETCKGLGPNVKKCIVIKTDAYGHGAIAVAQHLQDKIDYMAVATPEEAEELRAAGLQKPILILGYVWPEDYGTMIRNEVRIPIFKEKDARELSRIAELTGIPAYIHLKVDTGMNRIGFYPDAEAAEAIARIRKLPGLITEGIFTHFARADEADKTYTEEQFRIFNSFVERVEAISGPIPIHHCANSAAALEMKHMAMDMVRIGISLYGMFPSAEMDRSASLKPAMRLISHITFLKDVEMGEGISYNHTCLLTGDRKVATVPVGYGDGYPRTLSGKGYVLIRGKRAGILGRVCMDQMMVDVTEIPDVRDGDEVVLFGKQGGAEITIEELSDICGRFPYEFICDIGKRVLRSYKTS